MARKDAVSPPGLGHAVRRRRDRQPHALLCLSVSMRARPPSPPPLLCETQTKTPSLFENVLCTFFLCSSLSFLSEKRSMICQDRLKTNRQDRIVFVFVLCSFRTAYGWRRRCAAGQVVDLSLPLLELRLHHRRLLPATLHNVYLQPVDAVTLGACGQGNTHTFGEISDGCK